MDGQKFRKIVAAMQYNYIIKYSNKYRYSNLGILKTAYPPPILLLSFGGPGTLICLIYRRGNAPFFNAPVRSVLYVQVA